jgi:uncharacterized protein YbjT (DUF2867 family)
MALCETKISCTKAQREEIQTMRVLLAGASGLVGGLLVPKLSAHDLTLLGRRKIGSDAAQLIGATEDWPDMIDGHAFDISISTLGTTIRQAGSQGAFAAVDRDAVIALAKAARGAGARQFVTISSVGATSSASNFYLKIKGEAEAGVRALGFDRVDICRPGLLRGDRSGTSRPVERLMIGLSPLTDLLTPAALDQYRSINASDVAGAIAALVGQPESGVHIHHNREMLREAARIG